MLRIKHFLIALGLLFSFIPAAAQMNGLGASGSNPVKWSAITKMATATEGNIIVSAKVDKGYHFYTPENPDSPLQITVVPQSGIEVKGTPKASQDFVTKYEEISKEDNYYWDCDVDFTIPFAITDGKDHKISITVDWQACDEDSCTPPDSKTISAVARYATPGLPDDSAAKKDAKNVTSDNQSEDKSAATVAEGTETLVNGELLPAEDGEYHSAVLDSIEAAERAQAAQDSAALANAAVSAVENEGWWEPVEMQKSENKSPWALLIIGFISGLAALVTPCVWPLIPMTISFFLKKSGTKRTADGKKVMKKFVFNRDAIIYGISIVLIFLVLGLAITLIFGAGKLNELSTSAGFNIAFFIILVVFAVSFLGAFDIKLPEKWSNKLDSKAESSTGFISIFFMAFTLFLVSFSCTGPIIGTLLVQAVSEGSIVGPAMGLIGFGLGLAIPFSLFAMFPTLLQEMPKSGGWLNSVKVVLGFLELILALKFLSVADMAYGWRLLDREVFIALWIVLFTLLGMYLLGKLTFPHDDKVEKIGVFRFFLSIFPFAFAVYLLPGLWGAPLKATSAFVPPVETQDFNLHSHDIEFQEFDDYDEAMRFATENEKPVLVDFSGYGCVNCRKMEVTVFEDSDVRKLIEKNFVMVKLMVDERKLLPEPFVVQNGNEKLVFNTYGEKWTYLESHKFGENSQPCYVILDNSGAMMTAEPVHFEEDAEKFVKFLEEGLENYEKTK